ncbi:hypothetical protein CHS0354_040960 [Potamilus streckersoni]|uniref:Uncharacterized protein n=1 Tax=Potamilus streckersoni TaxID=2493646 RepID=A0AAE0W9N6_9BIVA|nr:hypothetical protein CHS0354_040960 [Potamilus streckersoni]
MTRFAGRRICTLQQDERSVFLTADVLKVEILESTHNLLWQSSKEETIGLEQEETLLAMYETRCMLRSAVGSAKDACEQRCLRRQYELKLRIILKVMVSKTIVDIRGPRSGDIQLEIDNGNVLFHRKLLNPDERILAHQRRLASVPTCTTSMDEKAQNQRKLQNRNIRNNA